MIAISKAKDILIKDRKNCILAPPTSPLAKHDKLYQLSIGIIDIGDRIRTFDQVLQILLTWCWYQTFLNYYKFFEGYLMIRSVKSNNICPLLYSCEGFLLIPTLIIYRH